MAAIAGLGILILDFFRTIVIDTVIKVILYPEQCYETEIKIGGPLIDKL